MNISGISAILAGNWNPSSSKRSSWSCSYGSWNCNYICYQCLPPLTLCIRIPLRRGVLDSTLCDKICEWLAAGRWFSPVTAVSSSKKTERNIVESGVKRHNPNPLPFYSRIHRILNTLKIGKTCRVQHFIWENMSNIWAKISWRGWDSNPRGETTMD